MKRALLVLIFLSAHTGCVHTPPDESTSDNTASSGDNKAQTFVYECPGDYSFVARVETGKAWLFLPGNTVDLPRQASASGSQYSNGSTVFRRQGDTAMVETGTGRHSGCRNNRAKAIWEHAKLNGVDFRATGNEPGWYMEISNKTDILLVTDYGQNTSRFESSTITSEAHSRTTVFNARNDNDRVEVVITGKPCTDSMSGESFPAVVSVRFNDRRYTGCGKALH